VHPIHRSSPSPAHTIQSRRSPAWIEKSVGFYKNWRNWSRSVLLVFGKPLDESNFFLKWFIGFGTGNTDR
jgi:hypothetical protein